MQYLLIGPVTADLVNDKRILGGTVSYAAPIVRAFGHTAHIVTSIPENEPLIVPLRKYAQFHIVPDSAPTTFENRYTDTGRLQILHHAARTVRYSDIPDGWRDAQLVHIAPLADEVDKAVISHFLDATILLTPQGYMRQWDDHGHVRFKPFFEPDLLSAVDIMVISKADIVTEPELEQRYADSVTHLVVTDGANGGVYYHAGKSYQYAAFPAVEREPTGAGDVFAAALLASLPLVQHDMHAALKIAVRLAAAAVTVQGVMFTLPDNIHLPDIIREAQRNDD